MKYFERAINEKDKSSSLNSKIYRIIKNLDTFLIKEMSIF